MPCFMHRGSSDHAFAAGQLLFKSSSSIAVDGSVTTWPGLQLLIHTLMPANLSSFSTEATHELFTNQVKSSLACNFCNFIHANSACLDSFPDVVKCRITDTRPSIWLPTTIKLFAIHEV